MQMVQRMLVQTILWVLEQTSVWTLGQKVSIGRQYLPFLMCDTI